jgi:hypothetical protein
VNFGEGIVRACMEPKTTAELKVLFDNWRKSYGIWYMGMSLAQALQALENNGVIEFDEGKWRTTEDARMVVQKYLG